MGRGELGTRLIALLWLATGGWFITVVAGILAIPVVILDVLFVLATGDGLSGGGVVDFVADSIMWNAEQSVFVLIGDGEFQLLPSG